MVIYSCSHPFLAVFVIPLSKKFRVSGAFHVDCSFLLAFVGFMVSCATFVAHSCELILQYVTLISLNSLGKSVKFSPLLFISTGSIGLYSSLAMSKMIAMILYRVLNTSG
jgi:hypothetical protein